jgi:hypothetical protein
MEPAASVEAGSQTGRIGRINRERQIDLIYEWTTPITAAP